MLALLPIPSTAPARPRPGLLSYVLLLMAWATPAADSAFGWKSQLPANTSLAVSLANPVMCFAGGVLQSWLPAKLAFQRQSSCYAIPSTDSAHAYTWPLPQGGYWEFHIPVVSSTTLTNSPFIGHVRALDGNSSPWLNASGWCVCFQRHPHHALSHSFNHHHRQHHPGLSVKRISLQLHL